MNNFKISGNDLRKWKGEKPISFHDSLRQAVDLLQARREGLFNGLVTGWDKWNSLFGGGLEMGVNSFVCARPGGGKTTIATIIATDVFEFNTCPIIVNYFNWEMTAQQQALRFFSKRLGKTVQELKDFKNPISDETMEQVLANATAYKHLNILFWDVSQSPQQVVDIIGEQTDLYKTDQNGIAVLNIYDHTRHVLREKENEEVALTKLFKAGNIVKKWGCHNLFLSQLGKELDKEIGKEGYRAPHTGDVFGADSAFQTADLMVLVHRPEDYNQRIWQHGLKEDGSANMVDTSNKLWAEFVKNREGKKAAVLMEHQLKYNRIIEL